MGAIARTSSAPPAAGCGSPAQEAWAALCRGHYPRSAGYDADWVLDSMAGPNVLWCAEALAECLPLEAGGRVLDLGCGDGSGAVFLAREFGVKVWAVDLMISPTAIAERVAAAELEDQIFPLHGEARSLPFPKHYFDAVVGLDSFQYFCTDARAPRMLARFVRAGGSVGAIIPGLRLECEPADLEVELSPVGRLDMEALHDADWWGRHLARAESLSVEVADLVPDGWRACADWYDLYAGSDRPLSPAIGREAAVWRADRGRELGLVRVVASVG